MTGRRSNERSDAPEAPAIALRSTLTQLHRDDVLRCLVAPRLRDLADALVEVPRGLLHNQAAPARSLAPPLAVLTPASNALTAFERDYSAGERR